MDIDRVARLLEIVERCSGHSGKLNSIVNEAMGELLAINKEVREEQMVAAPPPEHAPSVIEPDEEENDDDDETELDRRL